MDLDAADLVQLFDRIGIVAFALSGVEVGFRRRLDVFGLLVMGVVTATGGGLTRDVVLARLPLVISEADYLLWAIAASVIAVVVVTTNRRLPIPLVAAADALGLGAFAAAGALAGIHEGVPAPAVILLAIVTGTGGGVLRDVLAARVPLLLRAEVNATAAALGGATVWALEPISTGAAALAGVAVAAVLRVVTIALDINLPAPGGRGPAEPGA